MIARLASVLLIIFAGIAAAHAADVESAMPTDLVLPGKPARFLDLARQFVPDLDLADGAYAGRRLNDIRHLGGPDFAGGDAESFGLYDVSHLTTEVDGKRRMLVLYDFAQAAPAAQGVAVLALYGVAGTRPELLDAADIGFDASTSFFDQALLPVAAGSSVVLTMSEHFNSSQSYATHSMILVRNDRFELIDSTTLVGERTCGVDRRQTVTYAGNAAQGRPYAPIRVTVTDTASPIEEECADLRRSDLGGSRVRVTYSWNAARGRYLPDSDALERLEKENESRF